jgi:hypothetical protein
MFVEFAGIFEGPVVDYKFGTFPRLENDGVRILFLIGIALPERNAGAGSTGCSIRDCQGLRSVIGENDRFNDRWAFLHCAVVDKGFAQSEFRCR